MGKSRVAPLKPLTIQRMELTAAVVGVNLVKFLRNEIDFELESVTFWSDSISVFQYINNAAKRFHVFVANRIVEIHAESDPSRWRHLDSKSNPVDICSRGLLPKQLTKPKRVLLVPPFLKLPEKHWPEEPTLSPKLDGLEIRNRTNAALAQDTHNSALDRLLHSSSFSGLNPAERALCLTDPDDLFLHRIICLWRSINSEHFVADSFWLHFNFDQKHQYISSRLYEKLLSGSVRPNASILVLKVYCYSLSFIDLSLLIIC